MDKVRTKRTLGLGLWLLAVYAVTLGPQRVPVDGPFEPFSFCIICGDRGGADLILNMVLFLPLGLMAPALFGVIRTTFLGASLSSIIEVAQLFVPGRFSTFADIAANTAGTLAGAVVLVGLHAVASGRIHRRGVTLASACAAGVVVLVGGFLLEPAPTNAAYWGQRTPDRPQWTSYPGEVLEASFNGRPFPEGRLPDSLGAQAAMRTEWELAGSVRKGPPPKGTSALLAIFDGRREEILFLGVSGDDVLMRERLRAQDWGLDRPDLVAPGWLGTAEVGDTVRVSALRNGGDRCLAVNGSSRCDLGFTAGRLWSLILYPSSAPPWVRRFADLGWMLMLFLPIGLLSHSTRHAAVGWGVGASLVSVAVVLTRLSPDLVMEPAASMLGVSIGLWTARHLRNRRTSSPPG